MNISKLKTGAAISGPAILSGAYASDNDITNIISDLYDGLDVVSRELVGFIPCVERNVSAERAMVGQNVTYPITQEANVVDISPSMAVPEPTSQEFDADSIVITKSRAAEFGWVGEEQKGLNTSVGYRSLQADMFAQGLRKLTNEIEADIALEAALNASRMYGDAGTTPFANDVGPTAQLRKILDDNGAPMTDRSFVGDTAMGAALRTLHNLTRVDEAGSAMTLRDGELLNLHNFSIKESAQIVNHIAGNAAAATTDGTAYPEGATQIVVPAGGTGAILAGDVITFAGDVNQYVVKVGVADVAVGGTLEIVKPGLRVAIPATATTITVLGNATRNIGFTKSALHLVTRAPALPSQGDLAIDRMMITDPRSGLTFEVSIYPGYRKVYAEVAIAWGQKAIKPAHIAGVLG